MNIITTPTNMHGMQLMDERHYTITDTIIDLMNTPLDQLDEALSVTWGAPATFRRCLFRGTGKLVLIGSGDKDKAEIERGKYATFEECVFMDFGRRGIEVQAPMSARVGRCVFMGWGDPRRFDVRNFATWTHGLTLTSVSNSIYWQASTRRPLRQTVVDVANHIGQAVNDKGVKALFLPRTYRRGVLRAVEGMTQVMHCHFRPAKLDAIRKYRTRPPMPADEAATLYREVMEPFRDYLQSVGAWREWEDA